MTPLPRARKTVAAEAVGVPNRKRKENGAAQDRQQRLRRDVSDVHLCVAKRAFPTWHCSSNPRPLPQNDFTLAWHPNQREQWTPGHLEEFAGGGSESSRIAMRLNVSTYARPSTGSTEMARRTVASPNSQIKRAVSPIILGSACG